MPLVPFDALPDDARVWVFAADRPLAPDAATQLLADVDAYLARWAAHGQPLTCARAWRDDRFLAIAVDQRDAHASGCSIDGMFRVLQRLEPIVGASLVGSGLVLWRTRGGAVRSGTREEFGELAVRGDVDAGTRVFDPTVATVAEWRSRFEKPAAESWHAALM